LGINWSRKVPAEDESVLPWIETANNNFSTTMSVLSDDGANHEGMDYWFYGMESLFMYMDMSQKLLGGLICSLRDGSRIRRIICFIISSREIHGRKIATFLLLLTAQGTGMIHICHKM
jgi:hypothetical protein